MAATATAAVTEYTLDDVKKHKTESDCWAIIGGNVYELTKFLGDHPGGADSIVDASGRDATDAFEAIGHSGQAYDMMFKYQIGILKVNSDDPAPKRTIRPATGGSDNSASTSGWSLAISIMMALSAAAFGYYFLFINK
jgi:cytochrome-b5 reductase